ncbi:MAG: CBS domain-containing protein, partial [Chloroflexota bacterium]|nr:CBS domain-containing protein [Chloroflexota bacterium]
MRVDEAMTTPAVTVAPGDSVAAVAKTLLRHRVSAVAVVDDSGKLAGIITETDLLIRNATPHFPAYLSILETVLPIGGDRNLDDELRRVLATTAGDIMSPHVHTATPDADLGELAH